MDSEKRKWFALGLVFLIIAGVGVALIIARIAVQLSVDRMNRLAIESLIMMTMMFGYLPWSFLFPTYMQLSRASRTLGFFTTLMYVGIIIAIIGGIISIVGWAKYFGEDKYKY